MAVAWDRTVRAIGSRGKRSNRRGGRQEAVLLSSIKLSTHSEEEQQKELQH